jgi:hypothetical protein
MDLVWSVKVWTGFCWSRKESSDVLCGFGNEPSVSMKQEMNLTD